MTNESSKGQNTSAEETLRQRSFIELAQALTAQGVEKVVFITTGATSAFSPADLTAYASEAPFVLTHDGETVTFTAGETDLASLLQA